MLTEAIKILLDELSDDDLMDICDYCRERLESERTRMLKNNLERVTGLKVDGSNRMMVYSYIRAMLVYQMATEGIADVQISKAINRDRTTVVYLRRKWEHALKHPEMYPDVMPYWKKFQKTIKNCNDD
ncbi:MAG: hypothetical protein ACI39U_05430 [Candidatus Cryptobacteroides sp.]